MNYSTNYLAEEKIGKLMAKFSIPCIMSLLVASLYNIVDQIFIGQGVGYLGNGATNVVFPITVIALALALLVGDGCAAFLSICQGRKDADSAHKSVGNAIMVIVTASVLFMLVLLFCRDGLLAAFGATENNLPYAIEYYRYLILGIPFYMFANGMSSIIRADGNPKFAMLSTLIGAIINVILDPIAIFVLDWGMMGAAIATITGQIVSALLAVWYMTHPLSFKLEKSSFRPRAHILNRFLPLGTSIFLQALGRPFLSMGLSLLRDFVISVPLVLLLPGYMGVTGPLYSAPAADIISFIAVLLIMPRVLNFKKETAVRLSSCTEH